MDRSIDRNPWCCFDDLQVHTPQRNEPDPAHLDAMITVLNDDRTAHVPVPIHFVATDAPGIVQLSDATHEALTDASQVDLFQGRCPASKA